MSGEKRRILVVDDEPDMTLLFKMTLESDGLYDVYTFNDPTIALSNFKAGLYDLVILDIKMPEMDGFDLYQEMKKIDSKVKICFLTASEMYYEEFRKEAYCSLDKDIFLRKPIENEELLNKINKMISRHD
ncbi:MAG: response regulator [Nitrososphaeraceae archaeon]|jgi:DNA-binding response OmpR family regulator